MFGFSKKFISLEKLVNENGGKCEINVFTHGKDSQLRDTLSLTINNCAGVQVIRFCEIGHDNDAFSAAYEDAFIKAAEALYPGISSALSADQNTSEDIKDMPGTSPSPDAITDNSDDFQVFFGQYKNAKEGNWFSQLLENDPVILRKLFSIKCPTSEALINFQVSAKAYMDRRHLSL